ncbi:MAG TPA: nicotinate-nucleotide--dimethylbenzimidazole phosphoribosyltransferase [Bryobacteraceae bacterium]|nr:nicotinate-nucleotide--dimethylbenzimidazole phosphoribosyltransferase [Bryobacteraceae bacterium]
MTLLEKTIQEISPVDTGWIDEAALRQLELTKPPGSLGRLEEIANRCVAIRQRFDLTAVRPRIVLFAADHGVCAEGVSAYSQAVTAQMVLNFLRGGAAINALARTGSIELKVVDVGVAMPLPPSSDLISRRVASGSRNFCEGPAMTEAEMNAALETGIELARDAAVAGCDLLGFGEMGIGNTTSASAIAAALTKQPVEVVVGRGAGADEACMERKRSAVQRALALHAAQLDNPSGVLRSVGGLEIAAIYGFCLGAAAQRLPVVMDGFIATAGAALAARLCPAIAGYLFASHRSPEPGHGYLLAKLGLDPLLDLRMRLGEGTGAALAIPVIQAAVAAFTQMATFASAGVSNK